jgi:hypothetical protein
LVRWRQRAGAAAGVYRQSDDFTMPGTTAAALGPKKANLVRIGVAPSQAQMGQGSNAQGDYAHLVGAGVGGAMAGQAAGIAAMAAAQSAQEMAINQLAGFNGQIKSKDDVTVGYRLMATGQDKPRLENTLNAKATDGEDVLTPLILKAADTILTEVTKK